MPAMSSAARPTVAVLSQRVAMPRHPLRRSMYRSMVLHLFPHSLGASGRSMIEQRAQRGVHLASVFVSHRVADIELAERLADEIRSEGHEVWLDKWEINLGDSIVEKMDNGLEAFQFLILCYSSAGVNTPWISREWMSILARQLQQENVKILPVRLSGGSAPAILADLKYADLTIDWNLGIYQILSALRS